MLISQSENGVTKKFIPEYLQELEDLFALNEAQQIGIEPVQEHVANILNTFMWAYYEGYSAICFFGFELEDFYLDAVEKICRYFNVYYLIMLHNNGDYYLELIEPYFELNWDVIRRRANGIS
ncbi:hypothetical protein B1A99_24900 [Cohnella sp. CIP 111063]|uniref:hypothetical protein n=1 Tax=unclassified Cohnella TaxID=2636738 RepID=UPI000B8C12B4|nr:MULTISPECIES: hypothetical protein [unclassified Cohnella]OXS55022.1 hypothetical protein B1A99_24900 [Cohnella sp. CIP 111063]PRX65156.1 hypothetical protein B0G52_118107 [Cohnella sp. SGD-V74]